VIERRARMITVEKKEKEMMWGTGWEFWLTSPTTREN